MNDNYALSADLLRGADEIAQFMFGDPKERRRVYHLVQRTSSRKYDYDGYQG
jgi:hypothetical protein